MQSRILRGIFLAVLFTLLPGWDALAQGRQDPHEILRQARVNHVGQDVRLEARLRGREESVPFRIVLRGGEVRYEFQDPPETVVLRLGNERAELAVERGGRTEVISGKRSAERLRSTGISYEDLALRFLYWPGAKYLGDDVIRTRSAHILELHPRDRASYYGAVRVWVDKASGALLRIEGYDWEGRLAKRFEVISAQRVDGQWFLRSMRVETFDPTNKRVTDRVYLDVLPPSAAGAG